MKTLSISALLLSTIGAISFSGPADLANAKHVRWLATHGKIQAEEIKSVTDALDYKMSEVDDAGDETYVNKIMAELAGARASVQAQADIYKKLLDSTGDMLDDAGNLHGVPGADLQTARVMNGATDHQRQQGDGSVTRQTAA